MMRRWHVTMLGLHELSNTLDGETCTQMVQLFSFFFHSCLETKETTGLLCDFYATKAGELLKLSTHCVVFVINKCWHSLAASWRHPRGVHMWLKCGWFNHLRHNHDSQFTNAWISGSLHNIYWSHCIIYPGLVIIYTGLVRSFRFQLSIFDWLSCYCDSYTIFFN